MRTIDFCEFDKLAQRSHLTAVYAHHCRVKRLRSHSVLRVGLNHHAVDTRETVDIGDILTSVISRDGREHCGGGDTGNLALGRVDIDQVLWEIRVE